MGEWFTAELGSRQGDPISPLSFISLLERVMEPTECSNATNDVSVRRVVIKDLRFRDVVDLLAKEEVELQSLVNQLHTSSKEYGLQINTNKSKVMVFERRSHHHPTITLDTDVLECVAEFVYLGSLVTKDNDCSAEINCRINLASQRLGMLNTFWSSSELTIRTKINLLHGGVCLFSYAAETWTIQVGDSRQLLAFDMRCHRRILKVCWKDKVSNGIVRGIV